MEQLAEEEEGAAVMFPVGVIVVGVDQYGGERVAAHQVVADCLAVAEALEDLVVVAVVVVELVVVGKSRTELQNDKVIATQQKIIRILKLV